MCQSSPTSSQNKIIIMQMDDSNNIIYGLESQARSLTPQLAEPKEIRFFIATQTLKPNNQLHLIELNESSSSLSAKIFAHPLGEVWKLNSSPHDPRVIVSTYSCQKGSQVVMQSALLRLPESLENTDNKEYLSFESTDILDTQAHGNEIKTTEFHPTDSSKLATVIDGKILLHEQAESKVVVISTLTGKNSPKYSTGKWSQHHQGNQFVCLYDCGIRSYDIRDPNHCAWQIDDGQFIRDLDCNPNKQCLLVTGGDDGTLKIWDTRNIKEPVFFRSDHSHWIWSVRFNTFHDQLILSSSSDCKVLLTCASSVSSEASDENGEQKEKIPDGLLQTFDGHEDSVYCCEWSSTDPWIFASLSYDGRVIVSKVPKQYKYKILL